MNIKHCENGHSYDGNMYPSCPYCGVKLSKTVADLYKENEEDERTVSIDEIDRRPHWNDDVTVAIDDSEKTVGVNDGGRTIGLSEDDDDDNVTVGFFGGEENREPTVGWLVCEEGPERGRDYRIRPEKNSIGRGQANDIMVCDDRSILRDEHAIILYDPRGNRFYVLPGKGPFAVNDKIVDNGIEVFENDVLKIGDSRFVLIPYCKGERKW